MKAILMEQTGGPEVLRPVEVEAPEPGEGQVLVKVAASGVNYADLEMRAGTYPEPVGLPWTPASGRRAPSRRSDPASRPRRWGRA